MPPGIAGAVALVAWWDGVQSKQAAPPEDLRAEFVRRRRDKLGQGAAEFKQLAAAFPKAGPGGQNAAELFRQLFPYHSDRELAEYEGYRVDLAARLPNPAPLPPPRAKLQATAAKQA